MRRQRLMHSSLTSGRRLFGKWVRYSPVQRIVGPLLLKPRLGSSMRVPGPDPVTWWVTGFARVAASSPRPGVYLRVG